MATNITADVSLNIRELMREKKIPSEAEFGRVLDVSKHVVSKWKERNTYNVDKIVNAFPDVNRTWLITGEGPMLKPSEGDTSLPSESMIDELVDERYYTYLLPLSAQGGSFNEFTQAVTLADCERVRVPISNVDFAIRITGDSMAPEYPNGSQALIKKINERAFIEWGRVYVLDTCNGTVIKKLMPTDDKDVFSCLSINPEYPPFNVSLEDVYGIYRVLMCMSLK